MAKTHYETLGLKRTATAGDVKTAYRKIVLAHHPDRSKNPASPAIFLAATAAYEVLFDPAARAGYDESLDLQARREEARRHDRLRAEVAAAQASVSQAPRPGWTQTPAESRTDAASIAADLQRMTAGFARGNHAEADRLARQIAEVAPRNPAPYAVLGDLARLRGDINEAAKMYAYAAQFEPTNAVYQRRYEELLGNSRLVEDRRQTTKLAPDDGKVLAPMAGAGIVLITSIYIALSQEPAVFRKLPIVSTWTLGLPIALFLCGVGVGASLSAGNLLDRFQAMTTTATGRIGPAVTLALVALVNFWVAAGLYVLLGLFQRAWNFSVSRVLGGVAIALTAITLAGAVGRGHISPAQVLAWGGNLTYLGALLGWLVADGFRA